MKVRIGVGAGGAALEPAALTELVDGLDANGFDSLWLSEVLTSPTLDPIVGLSWAAARSTHLKLGTTILLPGRNLVRFAKQLAQLDRLSDGRLLVTLVPGLAVRPERAAMGVLSSDRGAIIDEAIPVLRQLWAGETVSYHGAAGDFDDVTVAPLPVQEPLELWLGGNAPAALERCGRLSDGWLPALCTPEEAAAGRVVIDDAATRAGRAISPEHFGVSIGYTHTPLSGDAAAAMQRRSRGHALDELVPVGMPALRTLLEQFVAVGFSKFVVRPISPPVSWTAELEVLAGALGDLQA
jgi:probable F420-dependent oxidoreductase